MSANALKRPALGQTAVLGTLYDARCEQFLPNSVLRGTVPEGLVNKTDVNASNMTFSTNDTYKEKFENMGVNTELGASFLAGLVNVEGSGRYLAQKRDTLPSVHRAMHYTITTMQEKLNFASRDIRDYLDFDGVDTSLATHVLVEISWGARSIVAATHQLSSNEDRAQIERNLKTAFRMFEGIENPDQAEPPRYGIRQNGKSSFEVTVHSDVLVHDETPPNDLESARRHIVDLLDYLETIKDGRLKPLTYTLLPINHFIVFGAPMSDISVGQLSTDCQEKFVNLLDELCDAQRSLNEYYHNLESHRFCVRPDHLVDVADRLQNVRRAESDLKLSYAHSVKAMRVGRANGQQLWQVLEDFLHGDPAPTNLIALTNEYAEKLKFIDTAMEKGAKYVGYGGPSLKDTLRNNSWGKAYVFYYSDDAMKKNRSWKESLDLLFDILYNKAHKALVLVVDCDATGDKLENSYISQFQNDTVVTKDISEQQKYLADKSLMQYNERHLDQTITTVPSQRRPVKIPCPGPQCSPHNLRDWICFRCHAPVEYGNVDHFLYCDCGRTPYDKYAFKCQNPRHGSTFETYRNPRLLDLLRGLPEPPELNILILGETGVGKSTFVNAFVNYLTFSSLDEGLSAQKLNWIIPCSFSTQSVDEDTGRLVQKEVKIGYDEDERDGMKGQSATQKATVYPLYINGTLVRLIDTPGIGDTRGIKQDQKNMVDVLSVLRNYDKLHGILILLKPNNARLNVMFKFCVKELLTHLHRNAAENMVFGFTNTRGSNYQPGDTFLPLQSLLEEYKDVIHGLYRDNVYCFDSESFRYLAAQKKGIQMGNLEDYRRSWEQSTSESHRLLARFQSLVPHLVKSTLSLNETRYLIAQLTAPMAKISAAIIDSIAKSEKQANELSNTRLSGEALKAKLNMQKTVVDAKQLDKPKTVCAHESCVKRVRDGGTFAKEIKIRKSLCAKELQRCAAFRSDNCMLCKHHWKDHEHIVVEYTEKSETTTDPAVEAALKVKGNEIKAKEAQIQALEKQTAEFKNEHKMLQEAQAQFSVYLKSNSITHYNDATLEYLNHLIREERSKVGYGGDPARLESLEKDRDQYQQFVDAMEQGKENKSKYKVLDEDGVYRLVHKLYNMKHYGKMLRDVAQVVGMAYAATFREKPYRVRGKNYWMTARSDLSNRNTVFSIPIRQAPSSYPAPPRQQTRSLFLDFPTAVPPSNPAPSKNPFRASLLPSPPTAPSPSPSLVRKSRSSSLLSYPPSAPSSRSVPVNDSFPEEKSPFPPPYEESADPYRQAPAPSISGVSTKSSTSRWIKSIGKSAVNKLRKPH